jgi:3-deoxy-manno-octulosonate cytidylyltransferase (CMP-KDO synthetase)
VIPPTAVIPARYPSSRFPGKPLALLLGKPMVQHVYERCKESKAFSRIVVATDDARIVEAVQAFGGEAELTSPDCASGSDRVAEVMRRTAGEHGDVFVNVQGDEPAISPTALAALVKKVSAHDVGMATLVRPLEQHERGNPNVVKVARAEDGSALFFSRYDIPFARVQVPLARWAHLGIYAYQRHTLMKTCQLKPTALEETESLEQLRALGHGIKIHCVETEHATVAVDRPEDVPLAEQALRELLSR